MSSVDRLSVASLVKERLTAAESQARACRAVAARAWAAMKQGQDVAAKDNHAKEKDDKIKRANDIANQVDARLAGVHPIGMRVGPENTVAAKVVFFDGQDKTTQAQQDLAAGAGEATLAKVLLRGHLAAKAKHAKDNEDKTKQAQQDLAAKEKQAKENEDKTKQAQQDLAAKEKQAKDNEDKTKQAQQDLAAKEKRAKDTHAKRKQAKEKHAAEDAVRHAMRCSPSPAPRSPSPARPARRRRRTESGGIAGIPGMAGIQGMPTIVATGGSTITFTVGSVGELLRGKQRPGLAGAAAASNGQGLRELHMDAIAKKKAKKKWERIRYKAAKRVRGTVSPSMASLIGHGAVHQAQIRAAHRLPAPQMATPSSASPSARRMPAAGDPPGSSGAHRDAGCVEDPESSLGSSTSSEEEEEEELSE